MKRRLAPLAIGTLGAIALLDVAAAALGNVLPTPVHLGIGAALAIAFALAARPYGNRAAGALGAATLAVALLLLVFPLGPRKRLLRVAPTIASNTQARVAERLEPLGLARGTYGLWGLGGIEDSEVWYADSEAKLVLQYVDGRVRSSWTAIDLPFDLADWLSVRGGQVFASDAGR